MINNKQQDLTTDKSESQLFFSKCYINNYEIPGKSILFIAIKSWILLDSFIPRLEMQIYDDGLFSEISIPVEGTSIKINLSKTAKDEDPIIAEFSVVDYSMTDEKQKVINITGLLKTDNLFEARSLVYSKKTSKQVISDIASYIGSSIDSSGTTTSDKMTWLQASISNIDMIKLVTNHSYINESDVLMVWLDIDNTFYIKSLKNMFTTKPKWNFRFDNNMSISNTIDDVKQYCTSKEITFSANDVWFSTYDILNYSGSINNMYGYGVTSSFANVKERKINALDVNGVDNLINTDDNVKQQYNKTVHYNYTGSSDPEAQDLYKQYNHAESIRDNIITSFMAQSIEIEFNALYNVLNGDIITVHIPSSIEDRPKVNTALSGDYLVVASVIIATYTGPLKRRVIVSRIGVNKQELVG